MRDWGHDVLTTREIDLERVSDEELLENAISLNRILITRDKDFGALIFLHEKLSMGAILLRINPSNIENVHAELDIVLQKHSFQDLKRLFCVVESGRHRIRRLD